MLFGDTEIKATATDIALSQSVKVYVDFMNESNPKYVTKLWNFLHSSFITTYFNFVSCLILKYNFLKNISEIFDAKLYATRKS